MKLLSILSLMIVMVSSEWYCTESRYVLYCEPPFPWNSANKELSEISNIIATRLSISRVSDRLDLKLLPRLPTAKELSISFSQISSIEDGELCPLSLPNLENITFSDKNFVLTKSHFNNCDKIKRLSVESKTLESTVLENLPNLEILILNSVNVPHFTKDYLQPLKQLKRLAIQYCHVEQIDPSALCSPPGLKILNLHDNSHLPTLTESHFENCNNIERIVFLDRGGFNIRKGAFKGFVNLRYAFISHLNVHNLSKGHLRGFDSVEHLKLRESNIVTIDEDAFENLAKLQRLQLTFNNISDVGSEVFAPLMSLVRLDLTSNRITSVDNIKHPTLEELAVDSNLISAVDAEAVKLNLPNLKYLSVTENNMTKEYLDALSEKLEGVKLITDDSMYP